MAHICPQLANVGLAKVMGPIPARCWLDGVVAGCPRFRAALFGANLG